MAKCTALRWAGLGCWILLALSGGVAANAALATGSADGAWREIPPPASADHVAICDSLRDRMIVYRRWPSGFPTWTLDLAGGTWQPLTAAGSPSVPLRIGVYDRPRDRILFFGGDAPGSPGQVWTLLLADMPTWSALATAGPTPPCRDGACLVYDPVRDRLLLLAGYDSNLRSDVWELTLSGTPTWSALSPTGGPPPARSNATATYDPARDRIILYGGHGISELFGDVWALDLSPTPAWTQLAPTGTPPAPREGHSAIYDPDGDQLIVFGGGVSDVGTTPEVNDVWALSLSGPPQWTSVTPSGNLPQGRHLHSAILDRARDRMIVYGGGFYEGCTACGGLLSDAWALSTKGGWAWTPIPAQATTRPPLLFGPGVYDPSGDRMLFLLCDYDLTTSQYRNSYWALHAEPGASWLDLAPPGGPAGGRIFRAPQYDPMRNRVIVFGGYGSAQTPLDDVWLLNLSGTPAWSELIPSNSPPALYNSCGAAYDPLRDRLLVFGGTVDGSVWALGVADPPNWTRLDANGGPPPIGNASGFYDPVRDRLVVLCQDFNASVWALSLGASPEWTQLPTTGTGQRGPAVYDPVRDRAVVFGTPTRALALGDVSEWSDLTASGDAPTVFETAVFDPTRDRVVLRAESRLWELGWGQGAAPAVSCPGDLTWLPGVDQAADYAIHNPFESPQTFDYTITSERAWPGFPITGSITVAARSTGTIQASLPVPDSVAAGLNAIAVVAAPRGLPRATGHCSHHLHDVATAVLVSLVEAHAEPDRVRLRWLLGPGVEALQVERRERPGAWAAVADASAGSDGEVRYEDRAVLPGHRYGYRLHYALGSSTARSQEIELDVPESPRFRIEAVRPNPATDALWVCFSLPGPGQAKIEVFDLMGRSMAAREVGSLGPGSHVLRVPTGRFASGIYVIRLAAGGRSASARAVIAR